MPKAVELNVELRINRVSCPGVWLCQDGYVALTVNMLDTTYRTGLVWPQFPMVFKDVFYFRKRFNEPCSLNNVCCLLKDETIYCELVQWPGNCMSNSCLLAQYLGSVNDVLFPVDSCWADGLDLLMRRCKNFPGILSPKIEISTKVRLDELCLCTDTGRKPVASKPAPPMFCHAEAADSARQKQVCHSMQYHREKCRSASCARTRMRSKSPTAKSATSLISEGGPPCGKFRRAYHASCSPERAASPHVAPCSPSKSRCDRYRTSQDTRERNMETRSPRSTHFASYRLELPQQESKSKNPPNIKQNNDGVRDEEWRRKYKKSKMQSKKRDDDSKPPTRKKVLIQVSSFAKTLKT